MLVECWLGPSKKLAKNAAAKAALATLCDISYSPMQMKSNETAPVESNKKQSHELPQTFADGIGKLVFFLSFVTDGETFWTFFLKFF